MIVADSSGGFLDSQVASMVQLIVLLLMHWIFDYIHLLLPAA